MVWVTNTSTVVLNFGSILTRPIPFPEKESERKEKLHIAFLTRSCKKIDIRKISTCNFINKDIFDDFRS